MTRKQHDDAAARLEHVRGQIERWRSTRTKHSAMPETLWSEATALAHDLGVNPVRSVLGISYASLRQRVEATADQPEFVELPAPSLARATGNTVLELSDATGARLKVEVPGGSAVDLVRVVAAFCGVRS